MAWAGPAPLHERNTAGKMRVAGGAAAGKKRTISPTCMAGIPPDERLVKNSMRLFRFDGTARPKH